MLKCKINSHIQTLQPMNGAVTSAANAGHWIKPLHLPAVDDRNWHWAAISRNHKLQSLMLRKDYMRSLLLNSCAATLSYLEQNETFGDLQPYKPWKQLLVSHRIKTASVVKMQYLNSVIKCAVGENHSRWLLWLVTQTELQWLDGLTR